MKKKKLLPTRPLHNDTEADRRPVAVIDIGSASIRLEIAQSSADGHIETLDFLQQALGIGHDSFTLGTIRRSTIESCVAICNQFGAVIREYGIVDQSRISVIATSAVREAANRDAFIDRIHIACGLTVRILEETDVARFTYLSYREQFPAQSSRGEDDVLLIEMGGGSTDVLHLQHGTVSQASNFALGSFRLLQTIDQCNTPADRMNQVIDLNCAQTVSQIRKSIPAEIPVRLVTHGSDARFAARELVTVKERNGINRIDLKKLAQLSEETLSMSVDELALRHGIPYAEAETVGPALRMYVLLAKALDRKEVTVTNVSMRSGVVIEMTQRHRWVEFFSNQVVRPALEIGRHYHVDELHVNRVAQFAVRLFDELQHEHKLTSWHRLLLTVASLLHDIGSYVSPRRHHKHSYYLILNSDLFGLTRKEIQIVAMVARYHRRSPPKPTHDGYFDVTNEERVVIIKLAALLRVADALDKSDTQRIKNIRFDRAPGELIIIAAGVNDVTIENMALHEKGTLFEDVYGLKVRICTRNTRDGQR